VNSSGLFQESEWAMSGSGSTFIYGNVDDTYRSGMSKHEIKEYIKKIISLAIFRDSSSGGCIRLLDITKDKVEREFIPYPDFPLK
jgi:20S proteasome subunit beta 1